MIHSIFKEKNINPKENIKISVRNLQKKSRKTYNPPGAFLYSKQSEFDYLKWLIGFIEAEGSFTVPNRGDPQFVITQGYRNIDILYDIKNNLGYGRVIKQGTQTFRFVVQDFDGLSSVINLVNGNLVLKKKKIALLNFIKAYNKYYAIPKPLIFQDTLVIPTLNDAWFSGFIDGDGCFSISHTKIEKKFRISFSFAQTDDICFLKNFFPDLVTSSYIKKSDSSQHIKINVQYRNSAHQHNIGPVIKYFQSFALKTTKRRSYSLWFYLQNQILNTKMTPQKQANIQKLCKQINSDS